MNIKYNPKLSVEKKKAFMKKEEVKIRQSLGEAVPKVIFQNYRKTFIELNVT